MKPLGMDTLKVTLRPKVNAFPLTLTRTHKRSSERVELIQCCSSLVYPLMRLRYAWVSQVVGLES